MVASRVRGTPRQRLGVLVLAACVGLAGAGVLAQPFQLQFPLAGQGPYTATITSVFDHSMTASYQADQRVVAFTGEVGDVNPAPVDGTSLFGYGSATTPVFTVNGHYSGGGDATRLYYDGHPGYDFSTGGQNLPVLAAATGVTAERGACLDLVALDHGNGYQTVYRHLATLDPNVTDASGAYAVGKVVPVGAPVGTAGGRGCSGNPTAFPVHLHFEVRLNDVPVDPYGWQHACADPYTRAVSTYLWATPPPGCNYSICPANRGHGAGAETGSLAVAARIGCAWTAVPSAGWITITSGSSGAGNGTVNYAVSANLSTAARNGTIVAAGKRFSVAQAGHAPDSSGSSDGMIDPSFELAEFGSGPCCNDAWVRAIVLQPDGKILVGGNFGSVNGRLRCNLARLNANGSLDETFDSSNGPNHWVSTIELQPDGKVLIAGFFTSVGGLPRNYVARLYPNGSADPTFDPSVGPNGYVWSSALQPDGKLLIAGEFSSVNGHPLGRIARLNRDGSIDSDFLHGGGANARIWSVTLQGDGRILLGGDFTSVNGMSLNRIARLRSDGSLDPAFQIGFGANAGGEGVGVASALPLRDGRILVGGRFSQINGVSRNKIARLAPNGSVDLTFQPGTGVSSGFNHMVIRTLEQNDGKVLLAGSFTSIDGFPRVNVARLHSDGAVDANFIPPVLSVGGQIGGLAVQQDQNIFVGGYFTSLSSTKKICVARLLGSTSFIRSNGPNSVNSTTQTQSPNIPPRQPQENNLVVPSHL